jgi:hypothetical protein
MKSKNPHAFWLRWFGASLLHSLIFTSFWMLNITWLFGQWYQFIPFNFISGLVLSAFQYWAMPQMMRPSAKRWFFASFMAYSIGSLLHGMILFTSPDSRNVLALILALYLPVALAQSWGLSQHFRKAWLFGLGLMIAPLLHLGQITIYESYQVFIVELIFGIINAFVLGTSLFFLHNYQRKETTALSSAYERLSIQEEEKSIIQDEAIALAQHKTG